MDEVAALPITRGYVVHRAISGSMTASDALPAHRPLPGSSPVIGQRFSGDFRSSPGRGGPPQFPPSPSERSVPSTPGGSLGLLFQVLRPFRGLRPGRPGSAPPLPHPVDGHTNGAAGFASCCGPLICSPRGAFDAGLRPDPFPGHAASLLPGLLAATRTGLSPAGDGELCWAHSLNVV
jgi:hypothetical protein